VKKPDQINRSDVVFGSPYLPPGQGGAFVAVGTDGVRVAGGAESPTGNQHSLSVTKDSGTVVVGPFAVYDDPHSIRIGIQNMLNDSLVSGIPSTIATPIPVMNFVDDVEMMKRIKDQMKDAIRSVASIGNGGD